MSLVVRGPVTPESAGWTYVGFEVATASFEGSTGERELCLVVLAGRCTIESEHGSWTLDGRPDPFSGPPDAAYLPPGTRYVLSGGGEVALCSAPATSGASARVLPGDRVVPETRGRGDHERTILPILMGDEEADSLLVCEVRTPAGHWSSYPPHKHDRDALPEESFLEETYYHRIEPPRASLCSGSTPPTGRSTRRWWCATATPCSSRAATTPSRRRPATTCTTST